MKVALFDFYTSGHHLPYANKVKQAIETVSDHTVTFLTLSRTDRCGILFDPGGIDYIDAPDSPPIEDRDGNFSEIIDSKLAEFCSDSRIHQYDVVHFLYADDILGPLYRHAKSVDDLRLIGELNGVFFHRGTVLRQQYIHSIFLQLLQSPAARILDRLVPQRTAHEALWQDLYLYRCLRGGTFDQMVVHSREAAQYLSQLQSAGGTPVDEVPYPAPEAFGRDVTKAEARKKLDLPAEGSILLFFGVMRSEKGVDFLLQALREYQGPRFTVVLAGPTSGVEESAIREVAEESSLDIITELEFVDTPELYYRAADAVIMPYNRQYGSERASQMFQEVCSALRPVIVPESGVLGRLTERWELGETYEQESTESLVRLLSRFASDGLLFSPERMHEYTAEHSYERVAKRLCTLYEA